MSHNSQPHKRNSHAAISFVAKKQTNAFGLDMTDSIKVKQGRAKSRIIKAILPPLLPLPAPIQKAARTYSSSSNIRKVK